MTDSKAPRASDALRQWVFGRIEQDARRCAEPMQTYWQCLHYHQAWMAARRCFQIGRNPNEAQADALWATARFRAFLESTGHPPEAVEAWLTKYRQEHHAFEREHWAFVAAVAAFRRTQGAATEEVALP